jgi:membrane fusion protein, multidrug efflux system
MKTLRQAIAIFACLLLPVLAGCQGDREGPGKRERPPTQVELWQAHNSPVTDKVESIGTLLGRESVTITAKVTEQVSAVHFDDGQMVKAGDVLVELVDLEQKALLSEADANLREAQLQLERLKKLGSDISTGAQIDVAEARVKASEARLQSISARIDDRLIRAPFDGRLGFRQVSTGALVTPGTVIAELDDISSMKLDFNVPETYLAQVKVGNTVNGSSPAWPGEVFTGEVVSVGSRVDPVSRAITVRATVDNPGLRLRPGMLMGVELIAGEHQAMVLPEQALIQVGGNSMAYVLAADNRAERRMLTIGKRVRGGVVVLEGIQAGDKVVVNGQFNLRPGAAVVVVPAAAPGS